MPELRSPVGPPEPPPVPPARRRASGRRPGWQKVVGQLLGIAAMFAVGFSLLWYGSSDIQPLPPAPVDTSMVIHPPVVVEAEPRLPPVAVVPPKREPTPGKHPVFDFDFGIDKPLLLRRRLPVSITMYCLKGTTRSGLPVRPGIVAADPRVLPLGTTIDLYVGLKYYGRFLVDDTGGVIKGAIIDIWTPSCTDARRFGRRRGAVVLVQPAKRKGRR